LIVKFNEWNTFLPPIKGIHESTNENNNGDDQASVHNVKKFKMSSKPINDEHVYHYRWDGSLTDYSQDEEKEEDSKRAS
jgi:hypothetical protein